MEEKRSTNSENLALRSFVGVGKFKSIRRAIKRGHMSEYGDIYPKRPFGNGKATKGSDLWNQRRIYEQMTHKNRKVC